MFKVSLHFHYLFVTKCSNYSKLFLTNKGNESVLQRSILPDKTASKLTFGFDKNISDRTRILHKKKMMYD